MVSMGSIGIGVTYPPSKGVSFSLDAYLASLSDGFFFDFTKTDRHFQEATGPTLADDVGEPIGLALDQRTWGDQTLAEVLAGQPELISNGDFSNGLTGWSAIGTGGSAAVVGGELEITGGGGNYPGRRRAVSTVAGNLYAVTVTLRRGTTTNAVAVYAQSGQLIAYNSTTPSTQTVFFVASGASSNIDLFIPANPANGTAYFANVSVKEVPGKHGIQGTGSLKPVRQTAGAKFDGSDDNLLLPYLCGAMDNFVVALVTFPATPTGSTRYIFGTSDGGGNRFRLGHRTDGLLEAAVGNNALHSTAVSVSNQRLVVGIAIDGTTVKVFADEAEVLSEAQSGASSTTVPLRIGCTNNNGTAGNHSAVAFEKIIGGRDYPDLATYRKIRTALLNS